MSVTAVERHPWTHEEIDTLQTMADEGMDAVDIALRLSRSVGAVKAKIAVLEQARRLREEAQRAEQADTAQAGRVVTYRLMEPLTEDEAFALGLSLPDAERHADALGYLAPFRSAVAKIERAISLR